MLRKINTGIRIGILGASLAYGLPAIAASESDEYVAEARQYLAQGKSKEAVIQLKNALKSDPSSAKARVLLGLLYLRSGDPAGAQKELSRAGRLGAPKESWMVGLGQALIMQNDFNGVLNKIVPDDGMPALQHATSLAIRGNAELALGNKEKALAAFDAALLVQASNPLARLGKARLLLKDKKIEEAAQQFTEVLVEYPDHTETRIARAELYRTMGKVDEAIADFSLAIEKSPNTARPYIGRGLAYVSKGELDKATADANKLGKHAKQQPIVHYLKALIAFQKKELGVASDELQLVLRAAPDNIQAQLLYGVVSYTRGEYTIAEDYLARSVQRLRDDKRLAKLLAATRLKLREPARAIEALEPLLSAHADDAQLHALLGTAYMQKGDNEKGTEHMARAVELAPDQALLRTQLAVGKIAMGNSTAAIDDLQSAVDLGQDLIQADVLLVLSYLNKQEHDKALEAAAALEKRLPGSPIPFNLTGLAYLAQGKVDEAQKKFEKALETDANFLVARMNLARAGLVAKKPDVARKHYEAVLAKNAKHVGAMMGLAGLELAAGDAAKAENWMVQANVADPKALKPILVLAESYLKRNQGLKATNLLSGLSEAQAKTPGALRIKGMAQLQSGEFSSAKVTFERLVNTQPNLVEGWFQLARAQAAAGDVAGSRESFSKAIELDPEYKLPLLWIGKGELELREKRYKETLDLSLNMQEHFPKNAMAYELEAAAHRGMGNIQKALKAVEKAVRAEGSSKRVNLFAHTLAASGNTPKAVYMLEEWLSKNKDDGVSWTTLGMMLQQMGRNQPALDAYESALKLTGGNPVVLNNMAWLAMDSNPKRALELAKQAYEIAPERAEIADTYGWVLFQSGKQRDGLNVLQQALVVAPRNPEIGLHVAEALHRLGRDSEAKPLLDRIITEHQHTRFSAPAQKLLKQLK